MKIFLCADSNPSEHRVPLSPEGAKKLVSQEYEVVIQKGAGLKAGFKDEDYTSSGALIVEAFEESDFYLTITPPTNLEPFKGKGILLCQFSGLESLNEFESLNVISFNKIPRLTKAQSMDVLSSQSNLAGYRAVVEASYHYTRVFPMMMTAAGTIAPARVTVLGAGVAGLQAIATAKRLGAIVTGYDVRPAAWEQIESLGAKALKVDLNESGDGAGGYAKEMSDDFKKAQEEALKKLLPTQNIIITTAQIPGKKAPILLTKEMIETLSPQTVIVDLAASTGGNLELELNDALTTYKDLTILSDKALLNRISYDASILYSRNVLSFITQCVDAKEGLKTQDDIVKACYREKSA